MLISGLLLVLNTLNVVLHTIGTYALLSLYNDSKDRPQRLLLINHSFCDSIRHCLDIVLITVELISLSPNHVVSYVVFYVKTVIVTGVCVVYYLAMVYITLNKLSKIILTSSYDHYWKEQRAKKLVLMTWAFGLLVCAVCAFVTLFSSYDIDVIFHSYIFPVSDFVFIAVAVTTLTVIIHSYNKRKRKYLYQKYRNRRRSSSIKGGTIKRSSYARRRSQASELGNNFFVPAGLILIFLVLIVIPDVTYHLVRGRSFFMGITRPECFLQKSPNFCDPLFLRSKF